MNSCPKAVWNKERKTQEEQDRGTLQPHHLEADLLLQAQHNQTGISRNLKLKVEFIAWRLERKRLRIPTPWYQVPFL